MKTNNNSKIVADANFKRCIFKPNKSDLKDIKARQSKLDLDNITIVNQTKTGYTAIIKDMWLQLKKNLQSIPYKGKGFFASLTNPCLFRKKRNNKQSIIPYKCNGLMFYLFLQSITYKHVEVKDFKGIKAIHVLRWR